MNLVQSFELVGVMLIVLIVCIGIVTIPGDDIFAVKLALLAIWIWGMIIPTVFYFLWALK